VSVAPSITKIPSGVDGLDSVLNGGLPKNRATLVCGGPGCGKSLLGMQFLVAGANDGAPGLFLAFEEDPESIEANFSALPWSLGRLRGEGLIKIESVPLRRENLMASGAFDLSGLFSRIEAATSGGSPQRVVLDGLDELFAAFDDQSLVRAELRRLIEWLGARCLTAIITAEQGDGILTRNGFEEYASDCVLSLDQDIRGSSVSRRLRVVKYRGSQHAKDWFPFVITGHGVSVSPVTSVGLHYEASDERVSSGIRGLDDMLGGKGYFRGSSVLISGSAGTGKTTFGLYALDRACADGESAFYFGFEESPSQLIRDAKSIGLDLSPHLENGKLSMRAVRAGHQDLESHLLDMVVAVEKTEPTVVVFDPISALSAGADQSQMGSFAVRLVHFLKERRITSLLTDLLLGGNPAERSSSEVSSICDTWILLRDEEAGAERNRLAYVLKSRGMPHSNQLREYQMTGTGVMFTEPFIGPGGVLTGAARMEQEARTRDEKTARANTIRRLESALKKQDSSFAGQLAQLEAEHSERKRELRDQLEALLNDQSSQEADENARRKWRYGRWLTDNDERS